MGNWRSATTRWIAAALIAVPAAGCGRATPADPPLRAADVPREAPDPRSPVEATVAGVTAFGYDLYRQVAEPGQNVVLSPLCVGYAFALARAGAAGETAAQLDRVFGYPAGVHDAYNAISQRVATVDGPAERPERKPGTRLPPTVTIANGLFAQRGFAVGQPFLRTLAAKYGAGVQPVDFGDGDAAKRIIDEWARQRTADRIREVFDSIDPSTRVVLANAIYLYADWAHPFADTVEEGFTRADGSTVMTPMMHQTATLGYAAGPAWQAVELPYAQSDLAMWVIVPSGPDGPDGLLSPDTLAAVGAGLAETGVNLILPRWDFQTRPDLVGALRALGLIAPFTPGADFSGIAPGLYVGDAMHAANITVDENGTEAAAVAAGGMATSVQLPAEITVRADRPFAFAIMHRPTRTPLFIGRVADPSVTR